jgi:hypothetical protein
VNRNRQIINITSRVRLRQRSRRQNNRGWLSPSPVDLLNITADSRTAERNYKLTEGTFSDHKHKPFNSSPSSVYSYTALQQRIEEIPEAIAVSVVVLPEDLFSFTSCVI